jgi:hypothetical protein
MKQDDLLELGRELMDLHGLNDWAFAINGRITRTLGYCCYSKKEICIGKEISQHAPDAYLKNIILHEIGHALTPGHAHDSVWAAKCIEIGLVDPTRFADTRAAGIALPSKNKYKDWVVILFEEGTNLPVQVGSRASPMKAIASSYLKHRKQETVGRVRNCPVKTWSDYCNGSISLVDLYVITSFDNAAALAKAAMSAESLSPKQPTQSTYTAFTSSIYIVGMAFDAFTLAYLAGKPQAAMATMRAQYYRVQKALG